MNIFLDLFNICFPVTRAKFNKKYHKINEFMSQGLLISRSRNLKLAQIARKSPTEINKLNYKNYRLLYFSLIRVAKKSYFNKIIKDAGADSKKLWSCIREAINIPPKNNLIGPILNEDNDVIMNNDVQKANYFNSFFSNIGNKTSQHIPNTNHSFSDFLPPPCPLSLFLRANIG